MARNPEIKVIITADSKQLNNALDNVTKQLKEFGAVRVSDSLNKQFNDVKETIKEINTPLKNLEKNITDVAEKGGMALDKAFRNIKTGSVNKLNASLKNTNSILGKVEETADKVDFFKGSKVDGVTSSTKKLNSTLNNTNSILNKVEETSEKIDFFKGSKVDKTTNSVRKFNSTLSNTSSILGKVDQTSKQVDIFKGSKVDVATKKIDSLNLTLKRTQAELDKTQRESEELSDAFRLLGSVKEVKTIPEKMQEIRQAIKKVSDGVKRGEVTMEQFANASKKAELALKRLKNVQLEEELNKAAAAAKKLDDAFDNLGVASVKKVGQEMQKIRQSVKEVKEAVERGEATMEDFKNATKAAEIAMGKLRNESRAMDKSLDPAVKSAKELQDAFDRLNLRSADQIEQEIREVEQAFARLRDEGKLTEGQLEQAFRSSTDEIEKLKRELKGVDKDLEKIQKEAKQLDDAFDAIDFKFSHQIEAEKKKIVNAFKKIEKDGKLSAAELKQAWRATEEQLEKLERQAHKTDRAIDKIGQTGGKAGMSLTTQFGRAFKTFSMFAGAAEIIQVTFEGIRMFVMGGVKAVEEFRLAVVTLAATMVTFNKDATPETLALNYEMAKKEAAEIVPLVEELAASTLLSGEQVQRMVLEFAKGGQVIDASNKKQFESFQSISNALAIILGEQLNMKQIGQEIGDLWQGQITMASSIGQILKATTPNIKEQLRIWKQQGILIEKVGEKLAAFGVASKDLQNSLQAAWARLDTTFKRIARESFADFNANLVETLDMVDEWLQKNKDIIDDGARMVERFFAIGASIGKIVGTLKKVVDFFSIGKDLVQGLQDGMLGLEIKGQGLEKRIARNIVKAWNKAKDAIGDNRIEIQNLQEDVENLGAEVSEVGEHYVKLVPPDIARFRDLVDQWVESDMTVEELTKKILTMQHVIGGYEQEVSDLADAFGVPEETIRSWEKDNLLKEKSLRFVHSLIDARKELIQVEAKAEPPEGVGGKIGIESSVDAEKARAKARAIALAEEQKTLSEIVMEEANRRIEMEEQFKTGKALTKEQQKQRDAIDKSTAKWQKMNVAADLTAQGLDKHKIKAIEIQKEMEKLNKAQKLSPQLEEEMIKAMKRELKLSQELTKELEKRQEISIQEEIAKAGTTLDARLKAIDKLAEAQKEQLKEDIEELKKTNATKEEIEQILTIRMKKIYKERTDAQLEAQEEFKNKSGQTTQEFIDMNTDATNQVGGAYEGVFTRIEEDGSVTFTNIGADGRKMADDVKGQIEEIPEAGETSFEKLEKAFENKAKNIVNISKRTGQKVNENLELEPPEKAGGTGGTPAEQAGGTGTGAGAGAGAGTGGRTGGSGAGAGSGGPKVTPPSGKSANEEIADLGNSAKGASEATNDFKSGSEKAAEAAANAKAQLESAGDHAGKLAEASGAAAAASEEATVQTNSFAQALQSVQDPIAGLANALLIGGGISATGESFQGVAGVANDPTSLLMAADRSRMVALRENIHMAQTGQLQAQGRQVSQEDIQKWIDEFNKLSEQLGTGERIRGGGDDNSVSIQNTYNVSTPNVGEFRKSQKQITEEGTRMAEQTARRTRKRTVMSGMR